MIVAAAIVNTALGTSVAGLSTLLLNKTGLIPGTGHHFSFLLTMNGSLTGDYTQHIMFEHSSVSSIPITLITFCKDRSKF